MAMTDPVEPPSGETFKDLGAAREVLLQDGIPRSRRGSVLHPEGTPGDKRDLKVAKAVLRGCKIEQVELRAIQLRQNRFAVVQASPPDTARAHCWTRLAAATGQDCSPDA